jgi:hypothetical protein
MMAMTPVSSAPAAFMEEATLSLFVAAKAAVLEANSWDAQLLFKLTSGVALLLVNPILFGLPLTEQDAFFDLGASTGPKGINCDFDPVEFPLDGDFNTSTADWLKLSQRLIRCAAQNGCHFCPEMEPACATQPSNACIAPIGKLLKCQPAKAQPLLIVGSPM